MDQKSLNSLENGSRSPNHIRSLDEAADKHDTTSQREGNDGYPNAARQENGQAEKAAASLPSPPNGGRTAWLTVLGCFLAFFASFGFVTGFGVFQAYYERLLAGRSLAIPSVILSAHVGPQLTLAIGCFFTVFGVMMAGLAKSYYQFLLSHGVCTGIGIGLTFMPIVGLPNQWFTTRRGLAVGLAIGGSSIGGVIWPILVDRLLNYDDIGYPWTMRTIGFIQLATMGTAALLIRTNVPRNKSVGIRSFPFVSALKKPGVLFMTMGLLLHFFGIYIPYFYISIYGQTVGASAPTAFYMSAVLNAATFFGRFVMGAVSDRIGHANTLILCVFISAMLGFAWQGVSSPSGSFVWAVFYGWFSGASISLQSPAAVPLVPEPKLRLIGPYVAILCQLSSFGSLGGGSIAGRLLRNRVESRAAIREGRYLKNDFHPMMWFVGSTLLGAVISYQLAKRTHSPRLLVKA